MDKSVLELRLASYEHDVWQRLCNMLEATGAVTMADLESSPFEKETEGQRLLDGIRTWGDCLVRLRMVQLAMGHNHSGLPDEAVTP